MADASGLWEDVTDQGISLGYSRNIETGEIGYSLQMATTRIRLGRTVEQTHIIMLAADITVSTTYSLGNAATNNTFILTGSDGLGGQHKMTASYAPGAAAVTMITMKANASATYAIRNISFFNTKDTDGVYFISTTTSGGAIQANANTVTLQFPDDP